MSAESTSPQRGNMRNGLISLLTLVVILSMATAAVLTVSTSHAMEAMSQRQVSMTREGYDAERSAQATLAGLDEVLAKARANGQTGTTKVLARVEDAANRMLAEACVEGVTATYEIEGSSFICTFVTSSGRMLQTTVTIGDDATYAVAGWKLTAAPEEVDTGDVLWTGSTAEE